MFHYLKIFILEKKTRSTQVISPNCSTDFITSDNTGDVRFRIVKENKSSKSLVKHISAYVLQIT